MVLRKEKGEKEKEQKRERERKRKKKNYGSSSKQQQQKTALSGLHSQGRIPPSFYSNALPLTPSLWHKFTRYDIPPWWIRWQPRGEDCPSEKCPMRLPNSAATLRNRAELDSRVTENPIAAPFLSSQIKFDLSSISLSPANPLPAHHHSLSPSPHDRQSIPLLSPPPLTLTQHSPPPATRALYLSSTRKVPHLVLPSPVTYPAPRVCDRSSTQRGELATAAHAP